MKVHIGFIKVFCFISFGLVHVKAEEAHEHRHHESHEHGVAELNLAIEGSSVLIELLSPAANIVGFEHKPENEEEQDQVKQAIERLQEAQTLFVFTESAKCQLDEAEVESELELSHQEHHHNHHESTTEHSEFDVSYSFSCESIEKLQQLEVTLFEEFSGFESIKGQAITPQGQSLIDLSPSQNTIEL